MNIAKTLTLATLLAAPLMSHAAADFITVLRTSTALSDNRPSVRLGFALPANLNRSAGQANSAALDLEVLGSEYNFNEVYINAPTTVCTANDTDANQAASVGLLADHDDVELRSERAVNHLAFDSSLLAVGYNEILICARNVSGAAGAGVGNLDNFAVRGVVVRFHTAP